MNPAVPGLEAFLRALRDHPQARGFFESGREIVVARAPGRLDLMGGIADYSGSLVLQLPLLEATFAAVQRVPEPVVRIVSLGSEEYGRAPDFAMPLAELGPGGHAAGYEQAQKQIRRDPARTWAAYAAGAFLVLLRERGVTFSEGARVLIGSDVPEGKGVSSSAALEVAVMQAVAAAYAIDLDPRELALLCQVVENQVAGAPCGVMDQMTAMCGEADRLLQLLCQPAELMAPVPLPEEVGVWGIDSGIRHSVAGADYTSVRVAAFMGYRILADQAGMKVEPGPPGDPVRVTDPTWRGYLANVTPALFEGIHHYLPEAIDGADFLARYAGTTDRVTRVDPQRRYRVRVATAHPVYEHFRVRTFAELLSEPVSERRLELLGQLMYQSHQSYSACGLGSEGTDRLVSLVRGLGQGQGLYGAKITGGGIGGTVAVLGRSGAGAAVEAVADAYASETGGRPHVFRGSSPGAAAAGVLRVLG